MLFMWYNQSILINLQFAIWRHINACGNTWSVFMASFFGIIKIMSVPLAYCLEKCIFHSFIYFYSHIFDIFSAGSKCYWNKSKVKVSWPLLKSHSAPWSSSYLLGGVLLEFGEEERHEMNGKHLDAQHTPTLKLPVGFFNNFLCQRTIQEHNLQSNVDERHIQSEHMSRHRTSGSSPPSSPSPLSRDQPSPSLND